MGRISQLGPIARCTGEYVFQLDSSVWLHLRPFKKYLFDAMDVEDPKLDGESIDLAGDWAFIVPMVEMASIPRLVREPLYIYEPAGEKRWEDRR